MIYWRKTRRENRDTVLGVIKKCCVEYKFRVLSAVTVHEPCQTAKLTGMEISWLYCVGVVDALQYRRY